MTDTPQTTTTDDETGPDQELDDSVPSRGLGIGRVVALVLAVAFLAAAVTWSVVDLRGNDPLSATDVGYMQDMGYHHSQAISMALLLLDKQGMSRELRSFAQEIIIDQRFEQGIFNATLDRFDHPSAPGEEVMGWMGEPVPRDQMEGLATDRQMDQLRAAKGDEAAALWIALMSEHHLGGLHMADWEARYGKDRTTRNLARATVRNQRSEIFDLARYRTRNGLPIPPGFSDPLKDQRLDPLSSTGD